MGRFSIESKQDAYSTKVSLNTL